MIGIFGEFRPTGIRAPLLKELGQCLPIKVQVETSSDDAGGIGVHYHKKAPFGGLHKQAILYAGAVGIVHDQESLTGQSEQSVAALIAQLYLENRLDELARVNGSFAAAVYDAKIRRLVLITDRLASYPIHLAMRGDGWVFASSIFSLIRSGAVAPRMASDGLAQLFTMQRTVGRTTNIAGLEALPAACITTLSEKGRKDEFYWHLNWKPNGSRAELAERLAEALRAAVARQTQGPSPALLLSGGIDSRLVLAASPQGALSCWTTASFDDNPELAIARQTAQMFGARFNPAIVEPGDTLDVLEHEIRSNNGLYPASLPIGAFMPRVAADHATALTGHGLDYTLRGYYLPARFLTISGSKTRLPMIKPIPARPDAAYVLGNLRQGPPLRTLNALVRTERVDQWYDSQVDAMASVLDPHLQSMEPLNAWDAFILHSLSKHYAFTGMMSIRALCHLNLPAFDRDVFDVYLSMTPAERVSAEVVRRALRILSPDVARLPNANTGFRADLPLWAETAAVLGRATARRLGIARRPEKPSAMHSTGSWQSTRALFAQEPGFRRRFQDIRARLDSISMGVFNTDALAQMIDDHLDGRAQHTKLLRQLLSHDAFVREYEINQHD
ncbi:MAG: asparagine synthase-related protein [Alphaproteobacteria bacterium]|nr:asparagine synthase-related protein [Alphaproteobacteria bacterium]